MLPLRSCCSSDALHTCAMPHKTDCYPHSLQLMPLLRTWCHICMQHAPPFELQTWSAGNGPSWSSQRTWRYACETDLLHYVSAGLLLMLGSRALHLLSCCACCLQAVPLLAI